MQQTIRFKNAEKIIGFGWKDLDKKDLEEIFFQAFKN